MAKKEISPEEKLLGLIKRKSKDALLPEAEISRSEVATGTDLPGKDALKAYSGSLAGGILKHKAFEPEKLRAVNRYLVIALAVLAVYFLADLIFIRPYSNVGRIVSESRSAAAAPGGKSDPAKDLPQAKDYSSYTSALPQRTVFGQSSGGASDFSGDVAASGEVSDRIGLVGIIAGDNPQAIIEDKKAQKTYYLNKGQSFDGYVVEDISDDKVILNNEGKKTPLFL